MIPPTAIKSSVVAKLVVCFTRIQEIRAEQEMFAAAYARYRSNLDALETYTGAAERLASLLGDELSNLSVVPDLVGILKEFRDDSPLNRRETVWNLIEACLSVVDEATVGEIQQILQRFGHETSRAAIESAMKAHRKAVTLQKGRPRRFALNGRR